MKANLSLRIFRARQSIDDALSKVTLSGAGRLLETVEGRQSAFADDSKDSHSCA